MANGIAMYNAPESIINTPTVLPAAVAGICREIGEKKKKKRRWEMGDREIGGGKKEEKKIVSVNAKKTTRKEHAIETETDANTTNGHLLGRHTQRSST
jgi:hypothetical protein